MTSTLIKLNFKRGLVLLAAVLVANLAYAAGGVIEGPNVVAPDRYVYYPGTEVLAKDEVRVVACGTGMPERPRPAFCSSSATARR